MAYVTSTINGAPSDQFELDRDEMRIGRHPECDIVVDAGAVSRYHAKLIHAGETWTVEDLGSRNGTFVNGQLLTRPHVLAQGDRIRISEVELLFHSDAIPEFARGGTSEMTFDGTNFGIQMVDESDTEVVASSKIEFRSSDQGLKMTATPEAKLAALIAINRNLTGAISLDEVLPKVLASLFEVFPSADRGFVVMETPDGSLVPRWVKTRSKNDETETVRISRTIIRKTMESGETILSLDAMDDSRFDSSESIADFSIRSMMCAPLHNADGEAIGALQIDSTQGRGQFRDEDIDLLTGVAAQASVVINNARLHEQSLRQKEVETDLKLATEVQHAFLPSRQPEVPTYRLESYYQAANHIGGDYFDYVELPDGRVAVVVADVVGHGVAAAMYMAKLAAETRFCLASEPDLARAVERLNDLMSGLHVERFVTYLLVVIDPRSDSISIVNAGHMPPIIRLAKTGEIVEPGDEDSGLPIAIDEGMEYAVTTFPFDEGDLAVMYTDGINEAMDIDDEEWGTDPLRAIVRDTLVMPGTDDTAAIVVKERIIESVFEHMGDAVQFDDMCMVIIERTESAQKRFSTNETVEEDLEQTEVDLSDIAETPELGTKSNLNDTVDT
ncbi:MULTISPECIES: SpoIIE family protein phosphatase [Pirellulaceae]|uniref:Serine phosphatase RsbU (Regulator of sigma subunit) n=1 Tax=Aporhodopirellula rubra TaxID=980271 RepID=A0A7W5E2G9_9BACT|nr:MULTISPECIES: SpoIIE family protein phosphatase [Pirellulaceae]EMI42152.1 protein serine phosphatase with GAF(s) sensor(s) [Rhodopirellula sp. SWK7]MBB3209009.1 serine phosphatase RsbU (regulator of sigma subunit) [Aporhodopirellula rubra]